MGFVESLSGKVTKGIKNSKFQKKSGFDGSNQKLA